MIINIIKNILKTFGFKVKTETFKKLIWGEFGRVVSKLGWI